MIGGQHKKERNKKLIKNFILYMESSKIELNVLH